MTFYTKKNCDRCGKVLEHRIMSMFNEDCICEKCKEIERRHPMYREACERALEEVRKGNHNFAGIGLPKDFGEKYEIRMFYDGHYYVKTVYGKSAVKAVNKLESNINIAKEYRILGVRKID